MKKGIGILLSIIMMIMMSSTAFATASIQEGQTVDTFNANKGGVENYGTIGTLNTNESVTVTNDGTIKTLNGEGTCTVNNGTIGYLQDGWAASGGNNSTVTENNGTIYTSRGDVGVNNGTIGYAYTSNGFSGANYGTVTENNGTVVSNHGTIVDNNRTVTINSNTIDYSAKIVNNDGTVKTNAGMIETNNGTIETNSSTDGYVSDNTGTINGNYGTVENNTGTILDNHKLVRVNGLGGVVYINSGEGYENASVQTNYGTVYVSGCANVAITYGEVEGIAGLAFSDVKEYVISEPTGVAVTIKTVEEANMSVPEGEEFVNWKDYLTGAFYTPGQNIMLKAPLNLMAIWQVIPPVTVSAREITASFTGTEESSVSGGTWNVNPAGEWSYSCNGKFVETWGHIQNTNGSTEWYYFNSKGIMCTGWQKIDGKWYYFCEEKGENEGKMLTNTTTPDGYKVGADGALI